MNDLTMDQFTQEMKTFEGLCNKALVDLDNHINNTSDLQFKDKLIKRKSDFDKFVNYVVNETNFITLKSQIKLYCKINILFFLLHKLYIIFMYNIYFI